MKTKQNFHKIFLKLSVPIVTLVAIMINIFVPVYASEIVAPGSTIVFEKSLFSSPRQLPIPESVALNRTNFTISVIAYARGQNLVEKSFISDNTQTVNIKLKTIPGLVAPDKVNLSVHKVIIKANRNIWDKRGNLLLSKGDEYTYFNTPKEYIVGYTPETENLTGADESIILSDGESRFVSYENAGASSATISVNYGDIAYGTMKVYPGFKGYLQYNSKLNPSVQSLNPDADITAINMGHDRLPAAMNMIIYKPKNSYIYEVEGGSFKQLSPPELKWNDTEGYWEMRALTHGKNLIISSLPLYTNPTVGNDTNSTLSPSNPNYWENKHSDVRVPNPMTGGNPNILNSKNEEFKTDTSELTENILGFSSFTLLLLSAVLYKFVKKQ